MINYEGTVIRPPSEAESLIFQVTLGCSDNNCVFCPAYKDKPFRIKSIESLQKEFKDAAKHYPETRRIFLADGDAICVPQDALLKILDTLNTCFPKLTRAALYGSAKSLRTKTVQELKELGEHKLGVIYIGVETGDEEVYRFINKYGSPAEVTEAVKKVKDAGIKTNVTVILGLGGTKWSKQHAVNTAKLLNEAKPGQIAALTLMLAPGTPLYDMEKRGEFVQLKDFEYINELRLLVENLEDFPCLFFANHASNYVPVQARFPKDKPQVIAELGRILYNKNTGSLKPEWMRGL